MSKTLKVIYSSLAVVMIVNSFVVALPILGHAQATEKQAIQQAEFTEAQKAEIEKAQKEARQAIYKELNLSITEQKFVEKYADKMEAFNQELDKYVTYNKKNGNATLNISAFYKNLKAIQTATGLTQKEVLTLKDIALKMVRNYNKTVNSIKSQTISANAKVANEKSKALSNLGVSSAVVTKRLEDKGFSSEVMFNTDDKSITAQRNGCSQYVQWANYRVEWWGYASVSVRLTDCAMDGIVVTSGVAMFISAALVATGVGASVAGPIGVVMTGVAAGASWMRWWCGYDGVVLKGKAMWYFLPSSNVIYATCD